MMREHIVADDRPRGCHHIIVNIAGLWSSEFDSLYPQVEVMFHAHNEGEDTEAVTSRKVS